MMSPKILIGLALVCLICVACDYGTGAVDIDKVSTPMPTPVEQAYRKLPNVKAASREAGSGHKALLNHYKRLKEAKDADEEARQLEALVSWAKTNKVSVAVTLGIRCPELTDEELLALSSFPTVKLQLSAHVDRPVIEWTDITFKAAGNVLRLIPLAVATKGGQPINK